MVSPRSEYSVSSKMEHSGQVEFHGHRAKFVDRSFVDLVAKVALCGLAALDALAESKKKDQEATHEKQG